jgi:hypothetical protein
MMELYLLMEIGRSFWDDMSLMVAGGGLVRGWTGPSAPGESGYEV